MERYIDATDSIVGRVAVMAAKAALLGDTVHVVNCEKAVISGSRTGVFADVDDHFSRPGRPTKGPFMQRNSDKFVRRIISRMLPRENTRGRDAVRRVLCYTGLPVEFKDKKLETAPGSSLTKLPTYKYVTVAEVCKHLGGTR